MTIAIATTTVQAHPGSRESRQRIRLPEQATLGSTRDSSRCKVESARGRFRNILFVSRAEEQEASALQRIVDLARRQRARVSVVALLHSAPGELRRWVIPRLGSNLRDLAMQDLEDRLDRVLAPIRKKGLSLTRKVLCGTPATEVIREVLRQEHDLVVTTHETRRGFRGRVLGSTALSLMRECPCPVWVMKPGQRKPYARILAAVGPDPVGAGRNALNDTILDLAASLARSDKSELLIVHAWSYFAEDSLRYGRFRLPKHEVNAIVGEEKKKHAKWLDELLQKSTLEGLRHRAYLTKGDAAESIRRLAESKRVDLIVMGTVCRTGIAGFLIGNTAETVLRDARCPVLTVKPKEFVSSVRL